MGVGRFLQSGLAVGLVRAFLVAKTGRVVSSLRAERFVKRWQTMPAVFRNHLEALLGAGQSAERRTRQRSHDGHPGLGILVLQRIGVSP